MDPHAEPEAITLTDIVPVVDDPTIVDATPGKKSLHLKLIASGFSFFVAGVNDGSLGSLLPYVLQSYHVSTGLVVVMYVPGCKGRNIMS